MLGVCGQEFNLAPEECLFVGDSADDMTSGHVAGCHTCLLTQPHNVELRAHETVHKVVESLHEVMPLLDAPPRPKGPRGSA